MGLLRVINAAISSPTPSEELANDLGETRLDVESPPAAGSATDGNPANPAGAGIEVVEDGVVRVFITDTGSSEDENEDEDVGRVDEDVDNGNKSSGAVVIVKVDKGKGKASSSSPSSGQSSSDNASSSGDTREFSSIRETPLHTTNRKLDKGKRKESFSKKDDIRPIRIPSAATSSAPSSSSSGWPGNCSAGPSYVSITQTPPERVQKLDQGKAKVINSLSPTVPHVRIETPTSPQPLEDLPSLSNTMSQAELLGVPLQKTESRRYHHHRSCHKDLHHFDGVVIEHEECASSSGGIKLQQDSEDFGESLLRWKKREAPYPLILIRLPCVNGVLRGTVHFHPLLPWTLCHPPPKNLLDKIKATESAGSTARYRLCINHVLEEHQIPDSGSMEKALQVIDDSLPNIYNDWDLGWVSVDGSREKGTYVAEWSGRFVSSQVSSETDDC